MDIKSVFARLNRHRPYAIAGGVALAGAGLAIAMDDPVVPAQTFLADKGLDTDLAARMAPQAYIIAYSPPLKPGLTPNGWAWRLPPPVEGLGNACRVQLDDFSGVKEVRSIAAAFSGLETYDITYAPVTSKELYAFAVAHEFRHCDMGNKVATPEGEGDSDYNAARWVAVRFKDPGFPQYLFNLRAASPNKDHDTALYLDARLKGKTPPTLAETEAAHDKAFALINKGEGDLKSLPALARSRVTMYYEARRFLTRPQ